MNNLLIRIAMTESGTRQWEAAQILGVHESTFSRMLREELPELEQQQIADLIRKNKKEEHEDE